MAVSVVESYVDARETHIDADGAHIVDLCAALNVYKTMETIHDETSETVLSGVKASYSRRAETVKKHGAESSARLSPNYNLGITAREKIKTEKTPTSGAVVDKNAVKTCAVGSGNEFNSIPCSPNSPDKNKSNTDATT